MRTEQKRYEWGHATIVLGSILCITILHRTIPHSSVFWHNFFQRLYYIPVIYAATRFGLRVSLATAAVATTGYLPHFSLAWEGSPDSLANQYAEVIVLFVVSVVSGMLADRERKRRTELQAAMDQLHKTHLRLQDTIEQLKRSNRLSAIGELSASLTHEIRNPLANILGAVDILEEQKTDDETQIEFMEILKKECIRLERLLTNLLSFARQPRLPEHQEVDILQILDSILTLVAPMANKQDITISKEIAPDTNTLIECDPEQLNQVLLNLTLNAIQAMPEGGEVILAIRRHNSDLLIQVQDQGCGIEEENLDRIFDPFFTTKDKGTGLGLFVAHQIVSQHEGRITVERNVNRGTTFSIILPLGRRNAINAGDGSMVSKSRT